MDIGFIGLGHMGSEMARNLLKAGHKLTVFNRTASRAEPLARDGATVAETPAGASGGEIVVTMLADDKALESVVFGDQGVAGALRNGAVHLSASTITVALSDRLAEAHRQAGQGYVAAPVLGRPEAAVARKLFVVAAGEAKAVERCRVVFDAIGQRTFVVGEKPSVANLFKLNANFLLASMIESVSEAVALIRKSGADPRQFMDIVTGTLFAAPAYKTYGEKIAAGSYEPAGFKMPLGLKDVRSALLAAEALSVPMPVASVLRDSFLEGIAQGGAEWDWSALGRIAARRAGVST